MAGQVKAAIVKFSASATDTPAPAKKEGGNKLDQRRYSALIQKLDRTDKTAQQKPSSPSVVSPNRRASTGPVAVIVDPVKLGQFMHAGAGSLEQSHTLSPPVRRMSISKIEPEKKEKETAVAFSPSSAPILVRRGSRLGIDERVPLGGLGAVNFDILEIVEKEVGEMVDSISATVPDKAYAYLKYAREQQQTAIASDRQGKKEDALKAYRKVEEACKEGSKLLKAFRETGEKPRYEIFPTEDSLDTQQRGFDALVMGATLGKASLEKPPSASPVASPTPAPQPRRRSLFGSLFGGSSAKA